jgi:hypothetical protein
VQGVEAKVPSVCTMVLLSVVVPVLLPVSLVTLSPPLELSELGG